MRGRLNRRSMQAPRAPATLTIKAIIIGVIFATTCTTTTKAANTCTPDNGGCCLATLRDGDVTDAELLPFHEQADGEPGVIVDDLTTGIDYELFFTLTMKNQFDENNAAIDKLLGVPLNALLENTANSFAKQPAVMGLAMITEEENGRWQQKRDWVPPADKDDIPEGKCLDPSGATSAEKTTSCPIQGVQNMPYLFVHSKRGVVLAVNDHDGSAYMPGHNANTRVGQGWRHTKNKVGYSKDNNGGALLGTDKYPSVTHIVDAADNNFIVVKTPVPPGYLYDTNTLAGETYQDALLGTHDIRLVVSGSRTAIFIGTELMHEAYTLDTKVVRPVYTNMRVKMGSAAIDHENKNLIKPQINLPTGTKIKNVRYYRRNSNWNTAYACKAEKTCLELKEGSAVADHWHFNYVAGVCGISKLGAGAATCNTETDRWFEAEATCTAMGARLCTEAEVKKSALVPRASYAHKYVLIKDTATCQDEGLEYIESKADCEEAASAEHLDQFDKEAATVIGNSVPYGCYYRAQFLSYNTGGAKSTTKDGYYGICKNPAFADNSNQAVKVYADGTKDTGLCENVAETQPIWVADPCDTGNGNGLGHKVLVSTGKGYATAGCIDEMIQLQDSPKDGGGNRIKPAVRCCASGTGEQTATTTTATTTATTTPTSSTYTSTRTSTTSTSTTSTVTTTTTTTTTTTYTTTTTATTTTTTTTTYTTTTTTTTATTTTTTTTTYTTTTTATTTTATTTTTTLNAEQLKENGATIKELLDGGMDIAELVGRGFSYLELVQDLDANIAVADLEDAGVPAADITVLRSRLADLEKGSNLGIIIGVVVGTLVLIVGIVLFYRSKSTIDRDATFVNDVEVKRRPKKAGSRPRNRPPSSWMQDASRTDAETLLKGCRSGTFLVRARNDTSYAFSVIIRNRVVHKLIKEATPGEFTVDGKGGEWGSSLESVVAVVSLQMGTKYECAMYPLSAAAKQPETPARRPIRGMANAQPRTPARNDTGTHANATTGEQTYEEIDDGSGDAAMHEKTYEEIDDSSSINNAGVNETAFTLNAAYSTVQESAAAASVSQQSVQVRRISGYENTGARANRGPDVPVVTINPHYHNDDATNDPTAVQHSTSDPYASLLAAASPYGTNDGAAVDFDYDDADDSDFEI